MKKLLITLLLALSFVLVFAVSVSAESLSNFINVDVTLTDGTQTVAYLKKGSVWDGYQGYDRVTLYADYTDTSKTISWENVKVFDGRNSEICTYDGETLTKTGAYPQTLLGHVSQSVANLEQVYYPQGALCIADSSYRSNRGYTALEYVWIPKTVEVISENSFYGVSTLKTFDIEEGSQLKEIEREAFRECSSLTDFEFPETFETVGWAAFYLSSLSGTVNLPNSVIKLDDGAFRGTKIEVFNIGDGPVELGYNIVGNDNDKYLTTVYIPIEAEFVNQSNEAWFASTLGPITFYVIAKEGEDASTFVDTLKSTGRVKFATQDEIDAGTAPTGYNAIIVEGYNKCDAFYNGNHNENDDNDCSTANRCSQCAKVMTEAISHSVDTKIEYLLGFDKNGTKTVGCKNDGCTALDGEAQTVLPIFTTKGYSTNSDKNAINGGYSVNSEALEAYEAVNGKITYGIVIANVDSFGGKTLFNEDKMVNSNKALQVEIDGEYVNFDCSIHFVSESSYGLKLLICAYVIDGDNISIVQYEAGSAVENTQISGGSYKSVTLATVVASLPANAWNEDN